MEEICFGAVSKPIFIEPEVVKKRSIGVKEV